MAVMAETYTHTQTHTETHTHTHRDTHSHTRTHTHKNQTRTHARTQSTDAQAHEHRQTDTHTHSYKSIDDYFFTHTEYEVHSCKHNYLLLCFQKKSMLTRTIHGPWNYYMNLKRCDIMHWLMTGQSSHPTAVGGVRS